MPRVAVERNGALIPRLISRFWLSESAFTIIELAIVLVVLGLVAAVAIPRINFGPWRVNAATRQVTGLIRSARQTAVRQQHDVIVSFDLVNEAIEIHENVDGDAAGEVDEGERVYRRPLPDAVVFGPADAPPVKGRSGYPTSFEDGALIFHANGAASESGVVYLESVHPASEEVQLRALWVQRSTGSVQQLRLRDTGWEPY